MLPAANRVLVRVLTWGVRGSLVLMAAGTVLGVATGCDADLRMPSLSSLPDLVTSCDAAGIVALGVILLALTPVAAVAGVGIVCWRHRQVMPALTATLVFAILLTSLVIATGA